METANYILLSGIVLGVGLTLASQFFIKLYNKQKRGEAL